MKICIPSTNKSSQHGFSLAELLVAIAVVGFLAGVLLVNTFSAMDEYEATVSRRNAQTIASLALMAQSAGDRSIASSTGVEDAVQKLIEGVHGQGPMQSAAFQISKLSPAEITRASQKLNFQNGSLTMK